MKYIFSLLFLLLGLSTIVAQNQKLANQYYITGEYEKSASVYKKLYAKTPRNSHFFERYISCLTEMESYDDAEDVIKKKLKTKKTDIYLYVMLGNLYERQDDENSANKYFRKAISNLKNSPYQTSKIANLFIRNAKLQLALESYEEGTKYIDKQTLYAYNMGDLYWRMGNKGTAIDYFLLSLEQTPSRVRSLKSFFQKNLDESSFDLLISSLYRNIQENPDLISYPELLQWTFVKKKEYNKALRQAKALDKRLLEDGLRVFDIGKIAFNAKDYITAIEAFQYIGDNKDRNSAYYLKSKKKLLNTKKHQIIDNPNYSISEFDTLISTYDSFLTLYGKNNQTATIIIEYAKLYAEYSQDHKKAIFLLEELIALQNINREILSEAKLVLGDYLIIDGDVWEATLLFSQVDKEFKEANLGERARFKNAKLSYYNGDFEWAQEQFDFLKSATSKLISNDAIDLSVFITDNLGLDSTETAMKMYAKADLLVFQHKYKEAHEILNKLIILFPDHSLQDDVLYTKAKIYTKMRLLNQAIDSYQIIIKKYPEEIRADNAFFELATIYELYLNDRQKAILLYEQLFIDYSGSTFAVEARKRYRLLRGDSI